MNVLRQALVWCEDEGIIAARPRFPRVKVETPDEDLPSDEAFTAMLAIVPPQCARALEFMMMTGLSPMELERLQVRDARGKREPCQRTVSSTEIGIGQRADFHVKQSSRRRWVPLNGRASDLWYEATAGMQPETTPFPKVDALQKAMKRAVIDVTGPQWKEGYPLDLQVFSPPGLERVTPKMMRKWFATKLSARGGDGEPATPEAVLQRLMGHARGSPMTRRHYVTSSDEQRTQAVGGLGL